ncbi:MAG: hypothetical protein F4197_06900 [Acidimicrobiia bacterium]|nr:hypothetical protein [Acidimicrobiia bacterium]
MDSELEDDDNGDVEALRRLELIFIGFILTIAHAYFEIRVIEAINERCAIAHDRNVSSFAAVSKDNRIGSIKVGNLRDILMRFGENCRDQFDRIVEDHQITFYSNIEINRQTFAHEGNLYEKNMNVTLLEIKQWFQEAERVLEGFHIALGLWLPKEENSLNGAKDVHEEDTGEERSVL